MIVTPETQPEDSIDPFPGFETATDDLGHSYRHRGDGGAYVYVLPVHSANTPSAPIAQLRLG